MAKQEHNEACKRIQSQHDPGLPRKDTVTSSPWGMEFGVQRGYDTEALVPSSVPGRDKPVDGADTLRHFSRANVSYLAPVGNGMTLTAGLFNSFIGYQSIYAKNNLNYTRSYIADNASSAGVIGLVKDQQLLICFTI